MPRGVYKRKPFSKRHKNNIKKSEKKYFKTHSGTLTGTHWSEETRRKRYISRKKYLETHDGPFAGHHHTKKAKLKIINTLTGRKLPEKVCKKISIGNKKVQKIAQNRPEVRLKKRLVRIKQIEKDNYRCGMSYNKKACELFYWLDELLHTKGRYAVYGEGEYRTKNGYFLDYINFDLKIIIEYDELRHYNKDGTLRDKDIRRQKEIQELFPDFKFYRIKEIK